jgi:hypothetical protein
MVPPSMLAVDAGRGRQAMPAALLSWRRVTVCSSSRSRTSRWRARCRRRAASCGSASRRLSSCTPTCALLPTPPSRSLLERVRNGACTDADVALINTRLLSPANVLDCSSCVVPVLVSSNCDRAAINRSSIAAAAAGGATVWRLPCVLTRTRGAASVFLTLCATPSTR